MTGLVRRLPSALSGRTATAAATYSLADLSYDIAIGGLPFLTHIDADHLVTRAGAQMRKDQFDTQQIPGEQSLANWWLRSQSTFIGGAGLLYQDPSVDNQYAIRFAESVGVNPWANGKLTLLRSTGLRVSAASSDAAHVVGYHDGTDRLWYASGTALSSDDGSATTAITWGGTGTIQSLATDGTSYYAADSTGVYSGAGTAAGSKLWDTGASPVVLGWTKGRLMAGIAHQLYELTGGTPPTLPAPKVTHLNTAWAWTAIAEGTNAIYAAGYAGAESDIYKLVLDADGAAPTLAAGGVLAAQMPRGEIVHAMTSYLGTFVGIGTSRGFRVGQIDDNGDIQYGPLLFESSGGVKGVAAFDRYFFVAATNAIDGKSGLYRVDLGQPLGSNDLTPAVRFAYATDLQTHVTGEVTGVTTFGTSDRMALAVTGQGVYLESASELEPTGTLTTGRVRFNTLEPKIFKFVSVKTPGDLAGSVQVSVIDPGRGETSIISTSEGSGVVIEDIALPLSRAVEWVQLKLALGRSALDTATGGEADGWQLKAMPGATRQRTFTIPLACYDRETDKRGQTAGYEGYAIKRLMAFEHLFATGDAVRMQDLKNNASALVVIDDYRFEQRVQPGKGRSIYGGVLWVELRTIADVVG